jgi:3'(2'), 5'-bisphosphate nucleotidase
MPFPSGTDIPFSREMEIAVDAVRRAMQVTRAVQEQLTDADTLTKHDRSPVTIADFAAQALVCKLLKEGSDLPVAAEEDAQVLRRLENSALLAKVNHFLRPVFPGISDAGILAAIDHGRQEPAGTFWTLDPVDGTKGFLRGEQFAVALALICDGVVELGVLGCPRLHIGSSNRDRGGTLFVAARGAGARMACRGGGEFVPARVSTETAAERLRLVESYESSHSDGARQLAASRALGLHHPPMQMDSQVKYGMVAAGEAEIYMRIPHPQTPEYREKIWDHAAGSLIVSEAGGQVTDILGHPLDFGHGLTLQANRGILATHSPVHEEILRLLRKDT